DSPLLRKQVKCEFMLNSIRLVAITIAIICTASAGFANPGVGSPQQLDLLQRELDRYIQIERSGGWPKITMGKKHYMKGESAAPIVLIKQRLRATGEFNSSDTSRIFTDELVGAVKKVQKQYGFPANGVVDAALVKELNVPAETRVDQIRVNMERLKSFPAPTGGTRLIANIPEFTLHVYEGDRHVFDMPVVVGKQSNQTVIFNDEMKYLVFSPSWHVPPSIVKNEILPAMRGSREYLWRHNYVIDGYEGGLPKIRQLPGKGNALGQVKFIFPNDHNIYFHDTPAKSLFSLRKRAFSHGCIRLGEPAKLAEYLLRNAPGWSPEKIKKAMASGKEQQVNLPAPAAVSIAYFTVWVDNNGVLNFREDIYGHDKADARKLASR
ncbi:MAG TPA: L,D-transpeptidase family protein, partial [Pedobacter sp.]